MNKASPVDLRKAMDATDALVKAGILFVPMPVLGPTDHKELIKRASERLQAILDSTIWSDHGEIDERRSF